MSSVVSEAAALPRLCAIVDADAAARAGIAVPDLARAFLDGGARFLQLRAKTAPGGLMLQWAERIAAMACDARATLVINDRFDIALLAGVQALHVGQDDLPAAVVRRWLGPHGLLGLSTHTPAQIDDAIQQPISYLAVGPVFGTTTKDTGYQPVGLDLVRHAAQRAAKRFPIVAIGGITLDNARSVIDAGASSVAVIGDLLATADPAARVRAYLDRLHA